MPRAGWRELPLFPFSAARSRSLSPASVLSGNLRRLGRFHRAPRRFLPNFPAASRRSLPAKRRTRRPAKFSQCRRAPLPCAAQAAPASSTFGGVSTPAYFRGLVRVRAWWSRLPAESPPALPETSVSFRFSFFRGHSSHPKRPRTPTILCHDYLNFIHTGCGILFLAARRDDEAVSLLPLRRLRCRIGEPVHGALELFVVEMK